jgi:Family of unknown function (DUF6113)
VTTDSVTTDRVTSTEVTGTVRSGRGPANGPSGAALTVATYLMLVLFGVAQAVVGTFFYGSGPAPLASLGFDVAIATTCLLGAWGLDRPSGGLAPAAGWIIVVFLLASGTAGGSVLIAADSAGEWFLFGGAAAAAAGVIAAFTIWSRAGIAKSRRRY